MSIDFKWLEEHVFMRELSSQDRKSLKRAITVERFTEGDVIIMEQQQGGSLYLLRSGRVDILLGFDGESLKLSDLGEGAQLGDMSFLDDAKASATIMAREDCQAYRITRDSYSQLFVYHQSVARDLTFSMMRNMSRNLRRMNRANLSGLKNSPNH